ncbi:inactive glucose-1-phosphate adenylyltransferase small subunit 2, chloroplastic-like isoform X2 [Malus sylvestris]|uniref:inactive glucose-1-phosphate adenylyltransferase small subunit 2, chloroplastic-like isoform X2 n=1 Tax=Malus sylvestris TaxID=3752 RepID=UPI0021ACF791|nr:inactive glucose-1-phosphate adenylyltransferase small subunit 2, chloroplastic-like isoform X2 [Malus sylvestris]
MVILQRCFPSVVSIRARCSVTASDGSIHENRSLKLHSTTLPPMFLVSKSHQSQTQTLLFPPANQSVAAVVFGDGHESQLYPLTKRRSEGAIPIAANYRLIDSVVSNCISSNISHIYALTQVNSTSLNSHLSRAYSGVGLGNEGFVQVIAAYQSPGNNRWFQGTADAVRRCLWVLEEYPVTEFLVLPGHHLYSMDYQKLIMSHRDNGADITIATSVARRLHDPGFGFLNVNSENQVTDFRLNLEGKSVVVASPKSSRKSNDTAQSSMASMGIYLINRGVMKRLLEEHFPKGNDFTSEVIPGAISFGMKVQAYAFDGYWEDMRNIKAFYEANMQSTRDADVGYNFYDRESPVYTLPRRLPPTQIANAVITNSVIGDGCILNGCRIKGAVIGMRTRIGNGAIVEDSVIMGSTTYQTEDGGKRKGMAGAIPVMGIGEDTQVRKAIIDKNARIGNNVMIINKDNVKEADREGDGYVIRDGILVLLPSAVIPDGTIL